MHNHSNGLRNLLSLFSYLLVSISLSLTNGATEYHCYDSGNFTTNSAYETNRFLILSSLSSHVTVDTIDNGGFYSISIGQDPDKVYAVALCRGDSTSNEHCVNNIKAASRDILTKCPNQKEAFIWGGRTPECLVHYADHPVFGKLDLPHGCIEYGGNLTEVLKSNLTEFDQIWERLTDGLVKKVSMGSSRLKFATEEADINALQMIYSLMQCTPDLSGSDCELCLRQCVADWNGFLRTEGGNSERANCYFGWALYPFYSPHTKAPPPPLTDPLQIEAPPPSVSTHPLQGKEDKTSRTVIIIVVAAAAAIMLLLIFICILVFILKKSRWKIRNVKEIKDTESLQFDIGTIRFATDNFSDANKLGQGGFGAVYKGTLPNRQEIAVKRLSMDSKQGDEEFKNEVTLVARLQHRNLVKLLGFCMEQKERILVYEFLLNSSLDRFIYDPIKREHLDWQARYKILRGIARGLLYLHEDSRLRIIHRDLKASNILLDSEMSPKISDFGMAFEIDQTHISTNKVVGTFGYMAPEYIIHKRFSVKTDVFSFGVLILEIMCGQKRSCFDTEKEETECLLTHAWKRWDEGTAFNVIDLTLREGSKNEMMKCIHIGLLCVQESVSDRPPMASVVHMLNSDSAGTLRAPSKPGFFMQSSVIPEASSSSLEHNLGLNSLSQNEASITELYPR